MDTVNLAQKFRMFNDFWSPKIVGELNDSHVKLVKFKGEFVWHHHETEDELFLVVKGSLQIKLRDQDIFLEEGEFVIIPRGYEIAILYQLPHLYHLYHLNTRFA
jgi:mannose-6-phosphate isomerase-like protein (cupin superfamily)